MLQISNLKLSLTGGEEELRLRAAQALNIPLKDLPGLTLTRRSVDARRKSHVHYVCTVRCTLPNEERVLKNARGQVASVNEVPYLFPRPTRDPKAPPPVVVGMGPAGLFAALSLAEAGIPPVVLERGRPVEERAVQVEQFWSGGALDPSSNVQFGEGGAGTFSDGKLNTGIHDPRVREVLRTFVRFGAPEDILYSHTPHMGTDVLRQVVKAIRARLLELGCDLRFSHRLAGLETVNGALTGLTVAADGDTYRLPCDALILAVGHSARDTFSMLLEAGVPMASKPFALGVRVEHSQAAVSRSQYGDAWTLLPPSGYKLACHLPDGRGVFSFCVCPGGQVVAAASQSGQVVTNGMSNRARDGGNINGGLLVGVSPEDYEGDDPLAGVRFQEKWEKLAFQLGGWSYRAPAQDLSSFLKGGRPGLNSPLTPTYRPGVVPADLTQCLPPFAAQALQAAFPILGRQLRGFDDPGALLTGVETRSSSPVRILRGEDLQSPLRGLYPCGEGAGWAGGITSAAADGMKVAESVASGAVLALRD